MAALTDGSAAGTIPAKGPLGISSSEFAPEVSTPNNGTSPVITPLEGGNIAATVPKGPNPNSIVDFLGGIGAPSDLSSRATLAAKSGVVTDASLYTGTADQNTKLLGILKQGQGSKTGSSVSTPAGDQGNSALGAALTAAVNPAKADEKKTDEKKDDSTSESDPTGTGTVSPDQHIDPDTGQFDSKSYSTAALSDATDSMNTALTANTNSYTQDKEDLNNQFDQWKVQFDRQKSAAVSEAKQYGGSYATEVEEYYDQMYASQESAFNTSLKDLSTTKANADLAAQKQFATDKSTINTNVANFGFNQQQFQQTQSNSALTQFRTLLGQTNVDYSDPDALKNMSDGEIVSNYGALVDLAVKGGIGYKDAVQQIRNGLFQQAKAAATTAQNQQKIQNSANQANERLAMTEERLQLAHENSAVSKASKLYSNFKAANTPGAGLLTAATYMSQIEAGYASGGKGVSALSMLDALVKIDTGGQAVRQGQVDILNDSGTWWDSAKKYADKLGWSGNTNGNTIVTKQQVDQIYAQAKKIAAEKIASGKSSFQAFSDGIDSIAADPDVDPAQVYGAAPGIAATQDFISKYEDPSVGGSSPTVQSNGKTWNVGQIYSDSTGNWTVDASGNWSKQ